MAIEKGKRISASDVREILALEKKDITLPLMRDLFGCKMGQESARFNTYDKFTLPAGRLYNKDAIETTVGRYILNLCVFPEVYLKKYGYVNETLKKGTLEDIENQMGEMILNDEMSTKDYASYLDYGEWLGMGVAYFLVPTMNYDINVPIPEVIALRDELFDKYADGVRRGESEVAKKIESEVLALAKKKIKEKGNEAWDFFESGVGKFENNYKKTSIMAGAVENPYTKKLDILKSNYIDGVDPKELPKLVNLTLVGGYSRGVETQSSGYERKKIDNALQTVTLEDDGSDCGTPYTMKIVIPKGMKNLFLYRYVLENNGKLTLLTEDNIDNYVDKEIRLRSPMFCKSDHICSKCAGELFYKMGVKNVGLLNDTMAGVLMNAAMKKFHDATVKFSTIDISNYIIKH